MAIKCDVTGRGVLFGNNVSHAKNRTCTTFKPNVREMRIYSKILGDIRMKISTRGLRTIEKHGGLDEYLKDTLDRKLTPPCLKLKKIVLKHTS